MTISPAAGGCAFVFDPGQDDIPVWHPGFYPGTVILAAAPDDVAGAQTLDPTSLGRLVVDRHDGAARDVVVAAPEGNQPLRLADADSRRGLAVIVPLDADFDLRLEAVARFRHLLHGRPAGPLPRDLALTAQRRARLIQVLHTLDFRLAGAGPREIAAALLSTDAAALPAIEWKSSAIRRKASRLIREALTLMNGGYRELLRGG